jgi:hypothetical protein
VLKRQHRRALESGKTQEPEWTQVGTYLTFRAELMPGRNTAERTFMVVRVLASKRVELTGLAGEHTEAEFETRR